jgi:hypothetical protein
MSLKILILQRKRGSVYPSGYPRGKRIRCG